MKLTYVILFSIFSNLLMLTGPLFMLQVYDRVLASRSEETLVALFALVAALYALLACLDFARGRVAARLGTRIQNKTDLPLFAAHLEQAAFNPNISSAPGLRDIDSVQSFFAAPAFLALLDLPWTPVFLVAIFVFHPLLGWLALTSGAILILLTISNQFLTQKRSREALLESESAHSLAQEAIGGAEIVLSQAMEENMTQHLLQRRHKALGLSLRASDWTGSFSAVTKSMRLFFQSAMLALGAWLVLQGEMTGGAMIAGTILLGRALAPVEQLTGGWQVIQRARDGRNRVKEMLNKRPQKPEPTKLPIPEAHLRVSNLTVVPPGSKSPNLRNLSFEVKPGQALGIIGRSGSGKSSLAKSILGLWPSVAGEIRLGSATIEQYSRADLGRHIGYLPQDVKLFRGTIAQNIARMSMTPDAEAVVKAAKLANAHEMITSLAEGYDTQIAVGGGQLSGGQKQRIALARAMYEDPVLLLLDEPNSALDSEGTEALNLAIRTKKEAGGAAIIMTHRPTAIAECDVVLIVEAGSARAFGPKDEVLTKHVKQ